MSRSKWKDNYIQPYLLKKKFLNSKSIHIWSRRSCIPFSYINKEVFIHNGKSFKKINVTREKVGFKFGEFAFTKTKPKAYKKKKQIKNK